MKIQQILKSINGTFTVINLKKAFILMPLTDTSDIKRLTEEEMNATWGNTLPKAIGRITTDTQSSKKSLFNLGFMKNPFCRF